MFVLFFDILCILRIESLHGHVQRKTESNINGRYNFSGLKDYSSYLILAVEDRISDDDIFQDVRSRNYGLSNRKIEQKNNPVLISSPIYRAIVNNVNLINNQYGKINLTNNISFDIIFNNSHMERIIGENKNYLYFFLKRQTYNLLVYI